MFRNLPNTQLNKSKFRLPLNSLNGTIKEFLKSLQTIENTIYSIGSDYDNKEDERIYISSINPIEREKPFLSPTYTPTKNVRFNGVGRIYSQISFKQDNQEFLAFTIINPISADLPNNTPGVIELNLYNITKKDWVYQKMPVRTSGKSIGGFDLIYKDKQIYFMSSDYVYCHNAQ